MKKSMIGIFAVCVGTLALAAHAADPSTDKPASSTDSAKKPTIVYKVADAKTEAKVPYKYQLIKKNGVEFYCRSERVTGSRTQKKDTCLTKDQMDAERASGANTADFAAGR